MPESRRSVIWSPQALADLEEIWAYYVGVAGPQTADNITRRVGAACAVIADFPLSGRARNELRLGLRSIAVRPHVIFYRLTEDIPQIVRVLDGRRDIDEIFTEE